ncbi:MAG: hypothetical protein PHP85_08395 [Gallionella sp.]|nr:hypothetical protein [Gallionella sp.]
MLTCPKCGASSDSQDQAGNPVEKCPSCGVYWAKFAEGMATGQYPVATLPNHDVTCYKCGYKRTDADSRLVCPKCGVVYSAAPVTAPAAVAAAAAAAEKMHREPVLIAARYEPKSDRLFGDNASLIFFVVMGLFLAFVVYAKFGSSPAPGKELFYAMNGHWSDGEEVMSAHAAHGKLYLMSDEGSSIVIEPASHELDSEGNMAVKTTTFVPVGGNPLDRIAEEIGKSVVEISAAAIKDPKEIAPLKLKINEAILKIKNGKKAAGRFVHLEFFPSHLEVANKVVFNFSSNHFVRKLDERDVRLLTAFEDNPTLKNISAAEAAAAEFIAQIEKQANLFIKQKEALALIAPDVISVIAMLPPHSEALDRDGAWDALGFTAPPVIPRISKVTFDRHKAFTFSLPGSPFGASCLLHAEPNATGWAIWVVGEKCRDYKVTELAIADVFSATEPGDPKFSFVKFY